MGKKKATVGLPILAAVDFSSGSKQALLWAARAAECFASPLLIVHVVHDSASAPGYYDRLGKKRKKYLQRIEEAAAEAFEEFLEKMRQRHPDLATLKEAESLLVIGLPVTRILEVAEKRNARLIVLGSQGRSGLPHLLLGSKSESVARLSPIPVTIVKSPKKPDR